METFEKAYGLPPLLSSPVPQHMLTHKNEHTCALVSMHTHTQAPMHTYVSVYTLTHTTRPQCPDDFPISCLPKLSGCQVLP